MQQTEFITEALTIARDAAITNPAYRFTGAELALTLEKDKGGERLSHHYRKLVDHLRILEKQYGLVEIRQKRVKIGGTSYWGPEYAFRDVNHPALLAYLGIQSPEIETKERELDLLRRATLATESQAKEAQRQSKLANKQAKINFWWSLLGIAIAVAALMVSITN